MLNPHRRINKTLVDGSIVIRDLLTSPSTRKGFEREIPVLQGFERAHSWGAGFGHEYKEGILYATKEVNQALQNKGIERFLRELFKEKAQEVDIYLTTVTQAHGSSLKLKEITYSIDAVYNGKEYGIFELAIVVEDTKDNPQVYITEPIILNDYSNILKKK